MNFELKSSILFTEEDWSDNSLVQSGTRMTFNKKTGNLVKQTQNSLKRKEMQKLTKKYEFQLFPENYHTWAIWKLKAPSLCVVGTNIKSIFSLHGKVFKTIFQSNKLLHIIYFLQPLMKVKATHTLISDITRMCKDHNFWFGHIETHTSCAHEITSIW